MTACGQGNLGESPDALYGLRPGESLSTAPVRSFQVYVVGNFEGNRLLADIYGIKLEPFGVERLTVNKRISAMSAGPEAVVVAAADQQVDKLGQVADGGEIVAIPGLGRPLAFSPVLEPDGRIRYQDVRYPGERTVYRELVWDPIKATSRVTTRTDDNLGVREPGPAGRYLRLTYPLDGPPTVSVGAGERERAVYRAGSEDIATVMWSRSGSGRRLIAIGLALTGVNFRPPSSTLFLDPDSGTMRRVQGWGALDWSPDGNELLVVKVENGASTLALMDPNSPEDPRVLGTVPELAIFQAEWVARP